MGPRLFRQTSRLAPLFRCSATNPSPRRPLPSSSASLSLHRHQARPFITLLHTTRARFNRLPYSIRTFSIILFNLLTWYPAIWFVWTYVFQFMHVTGKSMYPFLNADQDGSLRRDVIAVWMWHARLGKIRGTGEGKGLRRGSVVVFRSPMNPEMVVVKRVIALEGDTVITRSPYPIPQQVISLGHVWVEGEHPEPTRFSHDSNTYGAVSTSLIIGRVVGVIWPWSRRCWISADDWRGSNRVIERRPESTMDIVV